MAHPIEEAAAPSPKTGADAAADFEDFLFGEEGEEPDEEQDEPEAEDEGDEAEPDAEDMQDDEDDEPEAPAIEAPVSLNAEEKKVFAQLPKEAQAAWAASETRRNSQVQEATTKASNAQREAEARAAQADAQAKQVYAAQLSEFAKAFEPEAPSPQLAMENPAAYIAAKAQYDHAKAQHDQFVQQVQGLKQDANDSERKAFIEYRDRELMQIPEIANPDTRAGYLEKAFSVAEKLGYDKAELAEGMTARDVKALALIASLQDKADKYDAAMSRKMQRVRAGKPRTNTPAAVPHDHKSRTVKASKAWERVKTGRSKEAQSEAFADYLEASGHL